MSRLSITEQLRSLRRALPKTAALLAAPFIASMAPGASQAGDFLIYTGNSADSAGSATDPTSLQGFTDFQDRCNALGVNTTISDVFPTAGNIANFDIILATGPNDLFDAGQVAILQTFLSQGGLLILSHDGFEPHTSQNTLLAALGSTMQMGALRGVGTVDLTVVDDTTPFMTGIPLGASLYTFAPGQISGAGQIPSADYPVGTHVISHEPVGGGTVLLVADFDIINNVPRLFFPNDRLANHQRLMDNICEFEPFIGLAKELTSGPDADMDGEIDLAIEIGQFTTTHYDFTMTYNNPGGPPVIIIDTAPAEWVVTHIEGMIVDVDECGEADDVFNGFGSVDVFKGGKLGKKCHSSTKIHWIPDPDGGSLNVDMTTRESPGRGHKIPIYAPTSCGALYLNSGTAKVYELDVATGKPLEDPMTGEVLPPLFEAEPLVLAAVEDVDGDGFIDPSGNGNEDGDALTDIEDVRLGFDPCSVGAGTLYAGTDNEEFSGATLDGLAVTPVVGGVPGVSVVAPIDTTMANRDFVNGLAPTGTGTLYSGDPLSSLQNEISVAGVTLNSVLGPLDADCCNEDIAFDGTHLWRADWSEGPLWQYLPDGTPVASYNQTDVVGATFAKPSNTLWITKWSAQQVGTFDPGTNTFTPVFPTATNAGGLAYDIERGILWVGEQGGLVQAYDATAGLAVIPGSQHQPFGAIPNTVDGLAFIPD